MKLHQSIYQNNISKIIKNLFLIIFIFILSFKANTEIPEKYKIESSLPKCTGTDYKIWTNCYGEYEFPRIEYKGEWKNGAFHGKGILKEAWGDIYIGDFVDNIAEGFGRQDSIVNGKSTGYFEGELKNDYLNGEGIWVNENATYKGTFKDHQLNGFATIEYTNGNRYEGYFKKDIEHGQGTFIWSDGSKYIGEYKEGLRHGPGVMEWASGDKFIGEYFEDYLKKGEYFYNNGDKFIGEWDENEQASGKGKKMWSDGSVYVGEYKDGYRTGKGEHLYANGTKYIGIFFEGLSEGKGQYLFADGKYIGNFKNDKYDGKGIITWDDGEKYEGEWKGGEKHGEGKYFYANGNIYVGAWEKNLEQGYGIFTWSNGEKYEGEWKGGYRTGKGKYTFESGTVYEGDFFENRLEGNGIINYADGVEYIGEFKNGDENGQGSITYPNGDKYVGQFKDAFEHGQGKMVYANGDVYEGLWEDGKEAEGKTTLAKHTTNEKYYALIIGNNNYDNLENLDNAVNDAKDLEKVLKEKYGFETTLMIDKKSDETLDEIIKFTQNRDKNDNILIYYAGHGELIKKQKRGYWLPTDAGSSQDSKWLSNNNIKDLIASSDAKHILLVVDSCFSGSLMRGSGENKSVEKLTKTSIERLQKKKTRLVMTSGGNEQVADGIGNSKNSVFAEPLIKALKDNNNVIRSIELFQTVQNYVINNADQTPNHSLIHGTGHNGGEFLFFPKS
jgi:hypothetical protein